MTNRWTDGGINNIPIAFLKKRGDNKSHHPALQHLEVKVNDLESFHNIMSPLETVCMKCHIFFPRKNKKNKYFSMLSAENFTQSAKH